MSILQTPIVEIEIKARISIYHSPSSITNRRIGDSIHRSVYDRILNNRDLISAMALYKQCKLQKGGLALSM